MAKCWPADQVHDQVHLIYQRVLERSADNSGLVTWGGMLNRCEKSIREVIRSVGLSQEYYNRFIAPVSAHDAAVLMYRHFLAREPENPHVIDFWAVRIADNWQAAVNGFVDSLEYSQRFGDDTVPHP